MEMILLQFFLTVVCLIANSNAQMSSRAREAITWGGNSLGELGRDFTTLKSISPASVAHIQGFQVKQVSAGFTHALAVLEDGRVLSWGGNACGQLGRRTTGMSFASVPDFVIQLGSNETVDRPMGSDGVPPGTKVISVVASFCHSLALTEDGRVLSWGSNYYGQLGRSLDGRVYSIWPGLVSLTLPDGENITQIAAGGCNSDEASFSLALTSVGRVFSWGANDKRQLGRTFSKQQDEQPGVVEFPIYTGTGGGDHSEPSPHLLLKVAAGGHFAMALGNDGKVYTWGTNSTGQLGRPGAPGAPGCLLPNNQTSSCSGTPKAASLPYSDSHPDGHFFVDIECGKASDAHVFAVASDGAVFSWGSNVCGKLGRWTEHLDPSAFVDDDTEVYFSAIPGRVQYLSNVTVLKVAAGTSHAMALINGSSPSRHEVWSWGCNDYYQLGRPSPVGSDFLNVRPAQVQGLPMDGGCVLQMEGGGHFSIAVCETEIIALNIIAGIVASSVAALCIVIATIVLVRDARRKKQKLKYEWQQKSFLERHGKINSSSSSHESSERSPLLPGAPSSKGGLSIPSSPGGRGASTAWMIDRSVLTLTNSLAGGGSAVVYRGLWNDVEVAIKRFHSYVSMDEARVKKEARLHSRLRHPNILQFFGVCLPTEQDSTFMIVYEFMKRGSLFEHIHVCKSGGSIIQKRCIPFAKVLKFCLDIAAGMNYLHSSKIIHRDLKPHNILLDEQDNCKIADFGISRPLDDMDMMTTHVGTSRWMAPEAFVSVEYDEKVDVWSFGHCAWEMLTGRIPYAHLRSSVDVEKAVLQSCPPGPVPTPEEVQRSEEENFGTFSEGNASARSEPMRYAGGEFTSPLAPAEALAQSEKGSVSRSQGLHVVAQPTVKRNGSEKFLSAAGEFVDLLRSCWQPDPDSRPGFDEIAIVLREIKEILQKEGNLGSADDNTWGAESARTGERDEQGEGEQGTQQANEKQPSSEEPRTRPSLRLSGSLGPLQSNGAEELVGSPYQHLNSNGKSPFTSLELTSHE